jgi:hypothetical protein
MRPHRLWILLAVLGTACGGSTPTAPTAATVVVSISPNPLAVPAAGALLSWNLTFRETAGVGARIDRDETVVVDAAGVNAVQRTGFWAPGACAVCSGELRVNAGSSMMMSGITAMFVGPPRPGTFRYTVYYTDDKGNALSTTTSVPVQ